MTPERWAAIQDVFHAALERPLEERSAYLDQACAGDDDLREEVDAMLRFHGTGALDGLEQAIAAAIAPMRPGTYAGRTLGPYALGSLLGAGGMGEVYRARDTRLGRDVALKVIRPGAGTMPSFRKRFEREARAISRLSHPHICTLFDIGSADGVEFLVMELLEGESLGTRLEQGPLPAGQVRSLGAQVARALAAAHRQGIVHRDLKPGNIMITPAGVKLLDFGLAKAMRSDEDDAEGPMPPSTLLTAEGTWLGTAPYMAPEALRGRPTDARSDVFALGAVLYEMATGRPAFTGETPPAIAASILNHEPAPVSAVRSGLGTGFDAIVQACLRKDPDERWQSAHDIAIQLEAVGDPAAPVSPAPPRSRHVFAWTGWAVACLAVLAAIGSVLGRPPAVEPESITLQVNPEGLEFGSSFETVPFAVSPDGRDLAFMSMGADGVLRGYRRRLTSTETLPVPGTESGAEFFWSPDGRSLAFFSGGMLRRVDLATGTVVPICPVPRRMGLSGTWGADGQIVFATVEGEALYRVPAAGGQPEKLMTPDRARGEARLQFPHFLPDGRTLVFVSGALDGSGSLMLAPPDRPPKRIAPIDSQAVYLDGGYLLFARRGSLVAQRLDITAGRLVGDPVPVAPEVHYTLATGVADFSASSTGTIVYRSAHDRSRLAWIDRTGREVGRIGAPEDFRAVRISANGQRIVVNRRRASTGVAGNWFLDLEHGRETPLSPDDSVPEMRPIEVPGTNDIVFAVGTGDGLRIRLRNMATGETTSPVSGTASQFPVDVSPDGTRLAYVQNDDRGHADLYEVRLGTPDQPRRIRQTASNERAFRYAPDGRHFLFLSGESVGINRAFVGSAAGGIPQPVSNGTVFKALWRRDGREIVYFTNDRRVVSVPVQTEGVLRLGAPTTLFTVEAYWIDFDLSPDGTRFLAIVTEIAADRQPLTAILHWRGNRP